MKIVFYLLILSLSFGRYAGMLLAQAPNAPYPDDYPADPRVIAVEFFKHIHAGDAKAAWKCWDSKVAAGQDRQYEENQLRNTIARWIAVSRLEQALKKTLPELYATMKARGTLIPTPEELGKARFTSFRRLAIIRWSDNVDAGLPVELDTRMSPPKWFISMKLYRETTRSSIGDSYRTTADSARAFDGVTKDVLDGKLKTEDDVNKAKLRHLEEEIKKVEAKK